MSDAIAALAAGMARTEEAIKGLAGNVQALRKDIDELKPVAIFAESQKVRNSHADDDKNAMWKRIDEHRQQHETYAAIVNKAKGFMWAITGVWSLVGAASLAGLAWMSLAVLDSKEVLAVHQTQIADLLSTRELVTIISGTSDDPKAVQALNQIRQIKQQVEKIDRTPTTKIITVPAPPLISPEDRLRLENKSGHPGR